MTVPTGSVVYTLSDRTLVAALEKFSEVMPVIFPPANKLATDTFSIFATFVLGLPIRLGLGTTLKLALS